MPPVGQRSNMFAKQLLLIIIATASGTALLGLRQRQLEIAHENAMLHRQINSSRQTLWQMQASIAEGSDPQLLRLAVTEARLDLEPAVTMSSPFDPGSVIEAVPASFGYEPRVHLAGD